MKTFTIYYREKGNPSGRPIAQSIVEAENWMDALSKRTHFDKTWHSIHCNGKEVITLVEVRRASIL